jgi:hypothetical protein
MSDATQPNAAQTAREDIAFMRALVEEGARGPLFGGSILLATGLIYSVASAAVWVVLTRAPREAGPSMPWIWGSALLAQFLIMAVLITRIRRGRTAPTRSNLVFARVWNGVGLAIMSCLASFTLTAWTSHRPEVFAAFPAVILALYGVGWMVTASSSTARWTWAVALLSFAFAVVSGAFAGSVNLPLLFALALLVLLAAPGAILIKQARS